MRTAEEVYESLPYCHSGHRYIWDEVFVSQIQLEAFKAGMNKASKIVATHWNDKHQMTNQYAQAMRSKDAINRVCNELTTKNINDQQ